MNGKYFLSLLIPAIALLLSACTGGIGTGPGSGSNAATINIDYLTQYWIHSYEEEVDNGVLIYRVADFSQFPPSRFRMEYFFRPDFTCDWMYLHPADAHHLRPGTWNLKDNILSVDQDGTIVSYRILELTPDMLRMVRLS